MLAFEQIALSLLLALLCSVVAWLAARLRNRWLTIGLLLALAVDAVAIIASLALYPWSDLLVLVVAVAAGILLGRSMPARFRPWLILLLILSALDIAQIALSGGFAPMRPGAHPGTSTPPGGPLALGNFFLPLPGGHYLVGVFDLLIITALAEHWRRRSAPPGAFLLALVPGIAGFLLAEAAIYLTQLGGWPLLPFFTAGWLISDGMYRVVGTPTTAHVRTAPR